MGLFKRAHIRGMTHELTRQGIVTWPSKLAEEEAADAVADDLGEEEVPEVTGETGLSQEQAAAALNKLVEVAEEIAAKTSGYDIGVNKEAAGVSYEDAASVAAWSVMEKSAEETATGPDVPGQGAPSVDLSATAEAGIDASKVPSTALVGPKGTSDIDTRPGAVGAETPQPNQPGAQSSAPTGEVAKTSALRSLETLLHQMSKASAADGASLSGGATAGPTPAPRQDLPDNLVIPSAVAKARGQTAQNVPAGANVGRTMKHPGGTPGATDATPNKPAQDAVKQAYEILRASPGGAAFLRKLSEEAKLEEDKDKDTTYPESEEDKKKKLEEAQEEKREAEKEAHIASAIRNLSLAVNL